ncbi:MAG: alpha/beta hydrolase [Anaerolineaceae bacterium]|nr:alpha/beta hydrolase [Anaerolineaceae bacterium]
MFRSKVFFDTVCGIHSYFEEYGTEGPAILLLHGWGANCELFRSAAECLSKDFRVFALDFPGFGRSDPPPEGWSVSDYKGWLVRFLNNLKLDKAGIVAHSFGGRVSIKLAAENPEFVSMLVLVDSAGIRPKSSSRAVLTQRLYKSIRWLSQKPLIGAPFKPLYTAFYKKLASADYQASSGVIRQTFLKVVNEDLTNFLPRIQSPTLMIWGEKDEDTPLSAARVMESLIPDAGLVILKEAGHFSFLDKPVEFCIIVKNFLSKLSA